MVNAICYEKPSRFARYTVADGAGIAKGVLLKMTSPNTAEAMTVGRVPPAGIAWMEKVASDGSTEITAALDGVWGIPCSTVSTLTVGFDTVFSTVGGRAYVTLDKEKGYVFGKTLQTVATTGTIAKIRVNI
jgi:hypothetical protein